VSNFYLHWLLICSTIFLISCESAEDKITSYTISAEKYFKSGEYEAAHLEYANALQIDNNSINALYGVSKVFLKLDDAPKTYRYLQRVLEINPDHAEALVDIGVMELAGNQFDVALERSSRALNLAPAMSLVQAFHAAVLLKLEDRKGAISHAQKALRLEPLNEMAILVLATVEMNVGEPKKSIELLDRVLANKPQNIYFQALKIKALNQLDDFDGAVATFEQLIQIFPKIESYKFALAKQFMDAGFQARAKEVLLKSALQEDSTSEGIINYIRFLHQFENETLAVTELENIVRKKPSETELAFFLIETYISKNRMEDATKQLNHITEVFLDSEEGLKAKGYLARIAFQQRDYENGDNLIESILAADPQNTQALISKSTRLLSIGELDNAIKLLRTALRDEPNSAEILTLLALAHAEEGRNELAHDQFAKALAASPANRMVNVKYAKFLIEQHKYQLADDLLESYIAKNPGDFDVLQLLAQTKLSLNEWENAQKIADQLTALGAPSGIPEQIKGLAYRGSNDLENSISSFKLSYESAESKDRPLATLVATYVRAGKSQNAVSFLNAILKNDPSNYLASLLLGQVYLSQPNIEEGLTQLLATIILDPTKVPAYRTLNRYYIANGLLNKNTRLIERGVANNPGQPIFKFLLAEAQQLNGDLGASKATYREILSENPNSDIAINNLASILTESNVADELAEARTLASKFRDSAIPHFQDTLGWIYFKSGEIDNALYFLETAAESMPNVTVFNYHLGMAYLKSGDKQKAKILLKKATSAQNVKFAGLKEAIAALEALQ